MIGKSDQSDYSQKDHITQDDKRFLFHSLHFNAYRAFLPDSSGMNIPSSGMPGTYKPASIRSLPGEQHSSTIANLSALLADRITPQGHLARVRKADYNHCGGQLCLTQLAVS